MDDQQVGIAIPTVRVRRRKRQGDVAKAVGISASTMSRIERGRLDEVAVGTLRRVCAELDLRVEVRVRSRGGDLDRMVSERHAQLVESIIARLRRDFPEWEVLPEVSFSIWGERGVIDIFAWHAGRRALLVIEVKTEIVDVGEMLGTLDRKRRLAREVAAQRGWDPPTVSAWLVVAESRTNERRIAPPNHAPSRLSRRWSNGSHLAGEPRRVRRRIVDVERARARSRCDRTRASSPGIGWVGQDSL